METSQFDAYKSIALTAEVACGVLGRGEEFMLVRLEAGSDAMSQLDTETAHHKGFTFCGVIALVEGKPVSQSEPDTESLRLMLYACIDFSRKYAHFLLPEKKGDTVDWLGSLMALEDPRPGPGHLPN